MSLKPWLSRRVPGVAKSTLAKLRGVRSADLAVDELPPISSDELAPEVPDKLRFEATECHLGDIRLVPAKDLAPFRSLEDTSAVAQLEAEPTEEKAPVLPAESPTPHLSLEDTAAEDQIDAVRSGAEEPVSTEGPDPLSIFDIDTKPHVAEEPAVLADDNNTSLLPIEDAASADQLYKSDPTIGENSPPIEGLDLLLPPLDMFPAEISPETEPAAPEFLVDDPSPPSPKEFVPAVDARIGYLPPPPLMPPIDSSSTTLDETGAEAVRIRPAPKLLSAEEREAYMRAVNLFHRLKIVGNEGRTGAIHRLFDLVIAFPHGSSVRTIGEMLSAGYALHEIEDAASLKDTWRSDSSLWLRRSLGSLEIHSDCRHQTHLSWAAAITLSSALGREQALDVLQGILLHEWINMSREAITSSQYEFCYYHSFVLKRSLEIAEGAMHPMLQIFTDTIHDDPVMPSYIEVRSSAPNFTGQPTERIFLPEIHNFDRCSPTFSQQAITKKKHGQGEEDSEDAG